MMYMAAAVSDFYIPWENMVRHEVVVTYVVVCGYIRVSHHLSIPCCRRSTRYSQLMAA